MPTKAPKETKASKETKTSTETKLNHPLIFSYVVSVV